jgi:hypothetical protein
VAEPAGGWTSAALDHWRTVADPPADAAVAAYFAARNDQPAGQLVRSLVEHLDLTPEQRVPAIAEFLATAGTLPAWADRARMARGQAYFGDWALHQFTALYLASLPSAYAAARGVHVLWLTARLERDPERRLNETAQFLMDVTAPGSFGPGGNAVDRILHVRLMHAAVRWLIDHEPGVARPAHADPVARPAGPLWASSWGRPANQEDLAGTMLTFTTVVLDAFANSGVETSTVGAGDFFHLWTVIAHVLGVHDDLIPGDVAEGRRLQAAIFARQQEASAVGADLTATLLGLLRGRVPRPLAGLAPAMARRYIGDRVADMIGIPSGRGFDVVLTMLVWFTRITTVGRHADPVPRWLSRRLGRWCLEGLLLADRHGARVPFAIPDTLGGVPALAAVNRRVTGGGARLARRRAASSRAARR